LTTGEIVKRLLSLALIVVGLTSCVASRPPHIESDVHTGSSMAYGSYHNIRASTGELVIRAFISSNSDYGFSTVYGSDDKIGINEAWSFGKKFRYIKGGSVKRGCRGCLAKEVGAVILSESEFHSAAVNGFEFELSGKAGDVTGQIPPQAFSEVLGLQVKLNATSSTAGGDAPANQTLEIATPDEAEPG
jgi:hypothetical protein